MFRLWILVGSIVLMGTSLVGAALTSESIQQLLDEMVSQPVKNRLVWQQRGLLQVRREIIAHVNKWLSSQSESQWEPYRRSVIETVMYREYPENHLTEGNGPNGEESWKNHKYAGILRAHRKEIREFHDVLVERNYNLAKSESKIVFNRFRQDPVAVKEFCEEIPKGGMLHVHPWGTLDLATLQKILTKVNPNLDPEAPKKGKIVTSLVKNLAKKGSERILFKAENLFLKSILGKSYNDLKASEKRRFESLFFLPIQDGSQPARYFPTFSDFIPKQSELDFITEAIDENGTRLKSEDTAKEEAYFLRFMGTFKMISTLIASKSEAKEIMYEELILRSKRQKIDYLEISIVGPIWMNKWVEKKKWWPAEEAFAEREEALDGGLTIRYLIGFLRSGGLSYPKRSPFKARSDMLSVLKLAEQEQSDGGTNRVVGINLQGDENLGSVRRQTQISVGGTLLASQLKTKSTNLRITMHAGELGEPKNVRDAMIMGAERVGHGVRIVDRPEDLELARVRQLGVEVNLTSNLRLNVVKSLDDHPFLRMHRLGLKVSLSTDDEGIFGTDLNQECELAVGQTNIEYSELREILLNSIETAFLEEDKKRQLLVKLEDKLTDFESNWCGKTPRSDTCDRP